MLFFNYPISGIQVQSQVRRGKKKFEKLKIDVMQKIDLLSASRCNLLSSTLAAYQQALLKFWENTSRTMTQVSEQFKGLPTYQFQMLKSLNPLAIESGDKEKEEEGKEANPGKQSEESNVDSTNGVTKQTVSEDDDDQLISLDHSPLEEKKVGETPSQEADTNGDKSLIETDLLGDDEAPNGSEESSTCIDLLGDDDFLSQKQQSSNAE